MKTLIQFKTTIPPVLVWMLLVCFGLSPKAQAVVPPPDGGYPGFNTAEGTKALFSLTTGAANAAVGWYSLFSNAEGSFNTAVGAGSLLFNTADQNTATGTAALLSNTTGHSNTADGSQALLSNTEGVGNTATGYQALNRNAGFFNTANGYATLKNHTTGDYNIALGYFAGGGITTGFNNIDIGNSGVGGESNTIRIGDNVHTATYVAGIAGQTVGAGGSTCYVDNAGKLGVFLSARRFKTDIADMAAASEALLALRPVTFHYKPELDKTCTPQFGLVAEEVAKVNPDLVSHDAKGDIYTVRYEAVNAMLLNEFLKEHRKNEEQQKQINVLTAQLKEQAAQIQNVSAQLEASKPAPQVANNP